MKVPTKKDLQQYLKQQNPAGLAGARVIKNLTAKGANNHWNWVIAKGNKCYVARIAKPKGNVAPDIPLEFAMLQHLAGTGIAPTGYWFDMANFSYPLLIEDFIEGHPPVSKPNPSVIRAVIKTVARLHKAKLPTHIPLKDGSYKSRFKTLEEKYQTAIRQPLVRKVAENCGIAVLMPTIRKFFRFAAAFADKKPRVLLHGDLYLGNAIIAPQGQAVLIDWQKPAIGDPTADLGNMFVDVTRRVQYEQYRDLIVREYLRHRRCPDLAKLLDIRMCERDITSVISELRDAAAKFSNNQAKLKKYFDYKKPAWRIALLKANLQRFGI